MTRIPITEVRARPNEIHLADGTVLELSTQVLAVERKPGEKSKYTVSARHIVCVVTEGWQDAAAKTEEGSGQ